MELRPIILIIVILTCDINSDHISCKNLQGNEVDWYIIYKIPDINKNPSKLIQDGVGFLYMDPSTEGKWTSPSVGVDDQKQPLAFTLQQIYDSKSRKNDDDNAFYMMYNDEWPDNATGEASRTLGHTKGAMLFDQNTGFWLIHSAPKFPPRRRYVYPNNAKRFGQTALCITFAYDSLGTIAQQMLYTQPAIYDSFLPTSIGDQLPTLRRILKSQWKRDAPFNQVEDLESKGGNMFRNFAKYRKWNKELYTDFVAPNLKESLLTETWQNGRGDLSSNCSLPYTVNNIEKVKLRHDISFEDKKDHSKWAVSIDGSSVCIGDINRQKGQYKRSGGTMCLNNPEVWRTFRQAVAEIQDCPIESLFHDPGLST